MQHRRKQARKKATLNRGHRLCSIEESKQGRKQPKPRTPPLQHRRKQARKKATLNRAEDTAFAASKKASKEESNPEPRTPPLQHRQGDYKVNKADGQEGGRQAWPTKRTAGKEESKLAGWLAGWRRVGEYLRHTQNSKARSAGPFLEERPYMHTAADGYY